MRSFDYYNHENTKERKHEMGLSVSCLRIFVLSWFRIEIDNHSIKGKV
jgi:hypothetical protein